MIVMNESRYQDSRPTEQSKANQETDSVKKGSFRDLDYSSIGLFRRDMKRDKDVPTK